MAAGSAAVAARGSAAVAASSGLRIWGAGSFDNQAAADWVEGLEDADDLDLVEEALDEVLDMEDAADVLPSSSARALAAAETVAALCQNPAKSLPEEVRQWCFDNTSLDLADTAPKALQAVGVILEDCGLRAEFEDSRTADEWETSVEDLRDRLRS